MKISPHSTSTHAVPRPTRARVHVLRVLVAGLVGVACAVLVSCGGSSKALIPLAHAGPLLSDFEAVRNAAENANGECSATEAALRKTEEDFSALPATVDAGLRNNLHQGIVNLRVRAHELCIQPLTQSTGTTTTSTEKTTTTPPTTSTTTTTETPPTATTPTTSTPETPGPGGGTPAPGAGETPPSEEQGGGIGQSGGAGAEGAGGQEGGK